MITVNEELRKEALAYMEENRLSKASLAEKLDVHRTSVSQYFTGNNDGLAQVTVDKIEKALTDIIGFSEGNPEEKTVQNHVRRGTALCETGDSLGVIAICQSCQDYMGMGIIAGRSGFGKTFTLKYYSKSPKVCYIECNESMNARDLVKAIEKTLALPHITGSIDDRLDNIKDFFNSNPGYLLIIDEADKLITKYTQKKAEILRSIYDQADVGLILAGEPTLQKMIRQYIPRMANRVDFSYELLGLSKDEVSKYISGYEFDEDAENEIIRRATNEKNGCFRLLDRTFRNVTRVANGTITLDTVRQASSMMLL